MILLCILFGNWYENLVFRNVLVYLVVYLGSCGNDVYVVFFEFVVGEVWFLFDCW